MTNTKTIRNEPHRSALRRRLSFAIITLALFTVAACSRANTPGRPSTGPAAAVETRTYHGVGIVKRLDPTRPSIEIDHEEIKGMMPAMTMEFYVKDKSLLDGLKPGDRIAFTIEDGVGGVKITEISKR
jgi:Cu/Ag efflux protein CusF